MGTYDVNVNSCDIKVRVADHVETIIKGISELRNKLSHSQSNIVEMSIFCRYSYKLPLQLCVDNFCLLVLLSRVSPLPRELINFLDEPFLCFVGAKIDLSSLWIGFVYEYDNEFLRGMNVRELAARVLKKPDLLENQSFKKLSDEVGILLDDCGDSEILKALSSASFVFSSQQVKCLARYSHATYLIAKKLLNMLN